MTVQIDWSLFFNEEHMTAFSFNKCHFWRFLLCFFVIKDALANVLGKNLIKMPSSDIPIFLSLLIFFISLKQLIAEAWDSGGLYQVGQFPHWTVWSEWNGQVCISGLYW